MGSVVVASSIVTMIVSVIIVLVFLKQQGVSGNKQHQGKTVNTTLQTISPYLSALSQMETIDSAWRDPNFTIDPRLVAVPLRVASKTYMSSTVTRATTISDPVQGKCGDCWLIAALAAVLNRAPNQEYGSNHREAVVGQLLPWSNTLFVEHVHVLRFYYNGLSTTEVVFDDIVPNEFGKWIMASSEPGTWCQLIEKGFAKAVSPIPPRVCNYSTLDKGFPETGVYLFNRSFSVRWGRGMRPIDLTDKVVQAFKNNHILTTTTGGNGDSELNHFGIPELHAYNIIPFSESELNAHVTTPLQRIKCRNPWGEFFAPESAIKHVDGVFEIASRDFENCMEGIVESIPPLTTPASHKISITKDTNNAFGGYMLITSKEGQRIMIDCVFSYRFDRFILSFFEDYHPIVKMRLYSRGSDETLTEIEGANEWYQHQSSGMYSIDATTENAHGLVLQYNVEMGDTVPQIVACLNEIDRALWFRAAAVDSADPEDIQFTPMSTSRNHWLSSNMVMRPKLTPKSSNTPS